MDFNPLTKTYIEIQGQIDGLRKSEQQVTDELQWYASVDPRALAENLRRDEATAEKLPSEMLALEKENQENAAQVGEIAPAIGTLLNPFNWFAKDQIDLRRRYAQLHEIREQKAAERRSKVKELENTRARMETITNDLQRHRIFDVARRQNDVSQIRQSIAAKHDELAVVADRKRRVDEALLPLIQGMQTLESRMRRAESDLEAAQDFGRRLSSAGNSYERAMIHKQCEDRFGEGSPRKIIGECQKEIRQVERDCDKAKRRVEEIAGKAARKIETVVIDGNNLCYEGDTFIGLAAIETLLPLLSRICSVVVVFDSAIRRLLNTGDSGLQKRLGGYAKVHIVASSRTADETVLDLAAGERTYVLSNDRFGDFNEKSAVKGGRIIRHEIVNGSVFIHDLQPQAAYG